jgi:response regulator RpfG family c-di-GMP phosphodiesterase
MPPSRASQSTVLVVDQNPISLIATAGALDSAGYGCFCARTSAAALQVPNLAAIDSVIVDVGDDAEEALALIPQLRQTSQNSQLPFLLLADGIWAGLERRCEVLDGVRCLFKPIDPNVLLDLVQQSLWMPHLIANQRQRGARPRHLGWVEL